MENLVNSLVSWLISYASAQPAAETVLVFIGALVVCATVLKPFILLIVSKTKTQKDDIVAEKIYLFLDSFGIAFGQLTEVFKKKYPEIAKLADKRDDE